MKDPLLVGSYYGGRVLLSTVIALAVAYAAVDVAGRVAAARGPARRIWLAGGALSLGVGLWAMHYIGILALRLPVPVRYDLTLVVCSYVAAVATCGIGLALVGAERLPLGRAAAGSVLLGILLSVMHAAGMQSMQLPADLQWDYRLVALTVAVSIGTCFISLRVTFRVRNDARLFGWRRIVSALVISAAIVSMPYIGMQAVTFVPAAAPPVASDVGASSLGVLATALVTIIVLVLAVTSSVVDRKMAWQALQLRESEQRYRSLFERSPAGLYRCSLDGRLLDCNEAFARMFGFDSPSECLARPAVEYYVSAEDRALFMRRLLSSRQLDDVEHRLRRRDGQPIWVLEKASLVESADGTYSEGMLIDITRRRETEEQVAALTRDLIASVERYRMLVESTHAVPWEMHGETLKTRYMSPRAAVLFDCDPEARASLDLWDYVHDADRARVRQEFLQLASTRNPKGLTTGFQVTTARGRLAYVRTVVGAHPGVDDTGVILRGISFDVTEVRRLEMELEQAQKLESVGRLAAGVAHEINTPVQFVSDSLHFVREGVETFERLLALHRAVPADPGAAAWADARAAVARAEDEADLPYLVEHLPKAISRALDGLDRVATIVRSMKEFAHPSHKEMAPVDLNRAIQSTLTVARNEYKYVADIDLDLGDLPAVTCHGGDVNQVLLNIIVNAAQAIAEHQRGRETKGRIQIVTRQDGDDAVVTISDTGGGIPEAIRGRIFDPFFTTKDVGVGTGQGLAIARSIIVEKHGGQLTFETATGVGTTFKIRLPIAGRTPAGVFA